MHKGFIYLTYGTAQNLKKNEDDFHNHPACVALQNVIILILIKYSMQNIKSSHKLIMFSHCKHYYYKRQFIL